MMIDKRLIGMVPQSKKYIAANVALQWVSLLANIGLMTGIACTIQRVYTHTADARWYLTLCIGAAVLIAIRFFCTAAARKMSYLSSKSVKQTLRERIYRKLLGLGGAYRDHVCTAQAVQLSTEGVEQLESYFGSFLPQLFYALAAPVTLFAVLSPISLPSAVVLLLCVPLIPISIAAVQTWAKKLLGKYWGQYTALGDTFLENLQGLTTLKIYQTDGLRHSQMNQQAESFRRITMRVLTMQLNSITIMDLVAYGGAALGIVLGIHAFRTQQVELAGCLLIILLSADFFLPMRMLGSFFHIAMNGMAAADQIFDLLDLPDPGEQTRVPGPDFTLRFSDVSFAYTPERPILRDVSMEFPIGSFTAIVGESGCGKSTAASILMGRSPQFSGQVTMGGIPIGQIRESALMKAITYVSHQSYLFQGTVRQNLLMGCRDASDQQLWAVLEQVALADLFRSQQGLDTLLAERASNLSGGQCQRLALARALLHDSPVYIFDETTSNIDVESENRILLLIRQLARKKTVLLISHRLANCVDADRIYVMDHGQIAESGTHQTLLAQHGTYQRLWSAQQELEQYAKGAAV